MKMLIAGLIWTALSATGLANAAVSIVFDYSMDSYGFFTPERRAIAQAAATSLTSRMENTNWARIDTSTAGGAYELAIVNPSSLEVTWVANVVIPENRITVRLGAFDWSAAPIPKMSGSDGVGATQLMAIRNVSGGIAAALGSATQFRPVDASISFDLQGAQGLKSGITRQWHFGSAANPEADERNPADPNYNFYVDFYSSMIHELGHVLGIHEPSNFNTFLASDPNFSLAWTSRVQSNGQGGYEFTGARARQLYFGHVGQPIPLDTDTRCHWGVGVRSQSADKMTSLSYESNVVRPFRLGFSALEFAALEDMGYTITPASSVVYLNPIAGWNLMGNGVGGTLNVATAFADGEKISTVWKWISGKARWAFYSPSLAGQSLTDYAASMGYDVLTNINAGEGFWVNAKSAFSVALPAGTAIASASFQNLPSGWNLIAIGDNQTPAQFSNATSTTPPAVGQVAASVVSLWAWDASLKNWYFFAPSLANAGAQAAYNSIRGYLNFENRTLDSSAGFWVNKP